MAEAPRNGWAQRIIVPLAIAAILGAGAFWVQSSVGQAQTNGAVQRLGDRVEVVRELLGELRRDMQDIEQRLRELERAR